MALMSNLALEPGEEIDPQATALAYFIDKGYTPQQAAGIVGNLVQESGSSLNTRAVHDGGTGFGIAGFRDPTPGRGRKTNLLNFAKSSGADPSDLFTQLDFVHRELQGPEGTANRNLQRASDPASAATAFVGYERPQGWSAENPMGAHGITNRIGNAQALAPLAGQLASAGEGQEIEVNDAPVGGRAFAAGRAPAVASSGPIAGGSGSDGLMGSAGSDRLGSGLMSRPYDPGSDGVDAGSILGAIGMAMLSGTRQNPMGNLPAILNAQAKDRQTAENQRYTRWRDERDFGVGRSDKETAQKQWEASFGLQKTSNDLAQARESRADQLERERLELSKNADKRAQEQAAKPDVQKGANGAILERQEDGTYVTKVPGTAPKGSYEQNIEDGKKAGLSGQELQNYGLTGKLTSDKPLPPTMIKSFNEAGKAVENIRRYNSTFNDSYGGHWLMGEGTNTLGRNQPGSSYADQAQWWQDYAAHRNEVRHGLFGGALTPNEKAEFEKADITPGMASEAIRKNLQRQQEIVEGAARRAIQPHITMGVNPEAVEGAIGVPLDSLGIKPRDSGRSGRQSPAPAGGAAPVTNGFSRSDLEAEARRRGLVQ